MMIHKRLMMDGDNVAFQGDGLKAAGMKDNDLTLGDWEC